MSMRNSKHNTKNTLYDAMFEKYLFIKEDKENQIMSIVDIHI